MESLEPNRITQIKFIKEVKEKTHRDSWCDSSCRQAVLKEKWIGCTIFKIRNVNQSVQPAESVPVTAPLTSMQQVLSHFSCTESVISSLSCESFHLN